MKKKLLSLCVTVLLLAGPAAADRADGLRPGL